MWLFVLPLLVVIADQFSKYIVVENMALGQSIPVIEGIFHLTYILNPGAAFGMFAHSRLFFIGIAVAVIGFIIWARKEILASPWEVKCGAGLFLGGAVADIAICIGVGLIIWNLLKTELKRG